MKRCTQCDGSFGLIRHRWYFRQSCSKRCREKCLNQISEDRDRVRSWAGFSALEERATGLGARSKVRNANFLSGFVGNAYAGASIAAAEFAS
jgi:hypothetical protein